MKWISGFITMNALHVIIWSVGNIKYKILISVACCCSVVSINHTLHYFVAMAVSTALENCQLGLIYGLLSLCSLFCKQSKWTRTRSNSLTSHNIVVLVKSYWVTLTTFKCAKTCFVHLLNLLKTCFLKLILAMCNEVLRIYKVFSQI